MKALSIRQPWAYLIITGDKDIENRTWATAYRGPVLIHAGKTMDYDALDLLLAAGVVIPHNSLLPRGGFVGIAALTGVVTHSASPWFDGPYGWTFGKVHRLPFYPYRGRLGLFDVPDDLARQIVKVQ
jgi:hypothetical protein